MVAVACRLQPEPPCAAWRSGGGRWGNWLREVLTLAAALVVAWTVFAVVTTVLPIGAFVLR